MGTKKNSQSDIIWSEELIQDKLRWHFLSTSTKKYELFGRFVYKWESDYLAITKSGYAYEVEIKISRADFKLDSKKVDKHEILKAPAECPTMRPNYFYYAVPEGLITADEVPEQYGLIYVSRWRADIVKKAPLIHKNKADIEKLNLIDIFYYGMWNYIDKYRKLDIKKYQNRIKKLEKQCAEYDDMLSVANGELDLAKQELNKYKQNEVE